MHGHPGRTVVATLLVVLAGALDARAIEMFTYFGDGSRIGLPSLEVPIQAYPGIPLRSDRIRARNRAAQVRRANAAEAAARGGSVPVPGGGGITVRPMVPQPGIVPTAPAPPGTQVAPGPATTPGQVPTRTPDAATPSREAPLPGFQQPVFPPRR